MASNATTSYNFMVFILFVIFLSYCITACKKRRQRARAIRRNMNPGLAALARQEREAPVLTYTVAHTVPVAYAVEAGNMGITTPHTQAAIPTAYEVTQL